MQRPDPGGRSRLILLLALLTLWGDPDVALAGQAAGAPLPPIAPKGLAARIREARDRYDDLGLFEVTAPGFVKKEVKEVAASKENLTVTLKRSD